MIWTYEHRAIATHINLVVFGYDENDFMKYTKTNEYDILENRIKYFIKLLGYDYSKKIMPGYFFNDSIRS